MAPLDFAPLEVEEIEEGLRQSRPGAWRRLRETDAAAQLRFGFVAAWRVDMPRDWHRHPLIDHVVIGVNAAFPLSDPIVVATQGISTDAPFWPHIEPNGHVCLGRLRYSSPAATRILSTLQDALTVFDMPVEQRNIEHQGEFLSYWSQLGQPTPMPYLCLVEGERLSRDIVYCGDADRGVFFAEDSQRLNEWLSRTGRKPPDQARTSHLMWLDKPLLPDRFPENGADVMALAAAQALEAHVEPGRVLPVLIGCEIDGNPVYVCAEIEGISAKDAKKGFRPSRPRSPAIVAASFRAKPAARRSVQRVDYAWVHGRGKSADVQVLRGKRVAIVGCGALGGFLARALAQAGVGSLVLIDPDQLASSNVGRHALGMASVGLDKSVALAKQLRADFPHAVSVDAWVGVIQTATVAQQRQLEGCDLVIAAGIDMVGEISINRWRLGQDASPPLLWTWFEEFAVAGHAVAIVDRSSIENAIDADGEFLMRLTANWPLGEGHAMEAGCGIAYQPYSASDMMGTVNCAHRLTLDLLLGRQQSNVVRSWLGNREIAAGGRSEIAGAFDRSFCEISRDWAW